MFSSATTAHAPRALPTRRRHPVWAALAASLLIASLAQSAHSAQLADVHLVDRRSGEPLPVYEHQGEYWVAGRPGGTYSVDIRNRTGRRILAVVSVDGVNAISGASASARAEDGYVLDPWQGSAITGWRKSNQQVAAFYFSESDMSYASRTGRPRDVGVIGVALFREHVPQPPRPRPAARSSAPEPAPTPIQEAAPADARADRAMPPQASPAPQPPVAAETSATAADSSPAAPAASASTKEMASSAAQARSAKPAPAANRTPTLGTGHGALEASAVTTVDFRSATSRPEQIVRIRYDSYANLVANGVIPATHSQRRPNPFPADPQPRYVPDPPRH